jgi:hypothetical protein
VVVVCSYLKELVVLCHMVSGERLDMFRGRKKRADDGEIKGIYISDLR